MSPTGPIVTVTLHTQSPFKQLGQLIIQVEELPGDYYKSLVYNLHEENKALKKMNKVPGVVMEDSSKGFSNKSNNENDLKKKGFEAVVRFVAVYSKAAVCFMFKAVTKKHQGTQGVYRSLFLLLLHREEYMSTADMVKIGGF
ncbi:hypothetical protein Tco_0713550 [Tanacetum coccineum]